MIEQCEGRTSVCPLSRFNRSSTSLTLKRSSSYILTMHAAVSVSRYPASPGSYWVSVPTVGLGPTALSAQVCDGLGVASVVDATNSG